jgi:hypothetical protein
MLIDDDEAWHDEAFDRGGLMLRKGSDPKKEKMNGGCACYYS